MSVYLNSKTKTHYQELKMNKKAECPVCAAEVLLMADVVEGELILCPECGAELEVINVDPPELEEAPQEEEDWGE
jgi:alpha-aminoadipate carrier protein LysW